MRRPEDTPIRASLLDRLRDQSPDRHQRSGRQQLRELVASVQTQLESLLNTRWCCRVIDENYDELGRSLLNYGIPDFANLTVATPEGQQVFREALVEAIRAHEPRFINVAVEIVEVEEATRRLHFRIQGDLHAHPEPAHVAFDSLLDTTEQSVQVRTSEYV